VSKDRKIQIHDTAVGKYLQSLEKSTYDTVLGDGDTEDIQRCEGWRALKDPPIKARTVLQVSALSEVRSERLINSQPLDFHPLRFTPRKFCTHGPGVLSLVTYPRGMAKTSDSGEDYEARVIALRNLRKKHDGYCKEVIVIAEEHSIDSPYAMRDFCPSNGPHGQHLECARTYGMQVHVSQPYHQYLAFASSHSQG